MAGYSGTPLPRKLGIGAGSAFATAHPPDDLAATLGELPAGVRWRRRIGPGLDLVVGFYVDRSTLVREWPKLTAAVEPDGCVWIAWPKRASKVPTDLTGDVLRSELLPTGWVDTKVCAIDETWSGLRFSLRRELR